MYIIHHIFLKYLVKLSQSLFADGQVSKRLITHSIWQSMIWVQLYCIVCNGLGLTCVSGWACFVCCTLLVALSWWSIHQSSIMHACISCLAVRLWRTPVISQPETSSSPIAVVSIPAVFGWPTLSWWLAGPESVISRSRTFMSWFALCVRTATRHVSNVWQCSEV